jgi:hypothetical protein
MPLLKSTNYCVETLEQFKNKLDVTNYDIIAALPGGRKQDILDEFNEIREDQNIETAKHIGDLHDEEMREYISVELTLGEIIKHTLNNRTGLYTYKSDSCSLYRITEIQDGQAEPTESEYSVHELNGNNRRNRIGSVTAQSLSEAKEKALNQYGSPIEVTS